MVILNEDISNSKQGKQGDGSLFDNTLSGKYGVKS